MLKSYFKSLNRYHLSLFLFVFLIGHSTIAKSQQQVKVVGKVTDVNGLPLSGVSINLNHSASTTTTDEKGNFLLRLPSGKHVITTNFPGYFAVERSINTTNTQLNVSITLSPEDHLMKEVTIKGLKMQSASAIRTRVPIQDIPQAITIVGQDLIKQQASIDLASISKNIVGLNFTGNYSGAGSSQFFNARGFDLNESQNYRLNGVMVWNWGNQYADNIEQVEFLKGPASILFGDVAPGGVLNFVTKKPLASFMANVDFKTGSWGLARPAIDLTGPITKDRSLRYRLNTSFERSDSFRDKVSSQRKFLSAALAWDIAPKLTFNIEGVFKNANATDDAGLVSPDGSIAGLQTLDPGLYLGEPSREYLFKDNNYFATLTYELNPTWRVKATAFQGRTTNRPFGLWFDQPDTDGDFIRREYGFYQKAKNKTAAVDVYGTFYTGALKHQLLVGAEYQSSTYRQTNGGELSILDKNNIFAPVYGQSVTPDPANAPFRPYITGIERTGIHFQDQVMLFNEKLHVLLGLRLGRTVQGNDYIESDLEGTPYEGYEDDIVSKNIVTPRLGLVYKINPSISTYASYTKGYEINSPDLFALNYLEYASPPATISSQVELGMKMNLNERTSVTLSAFKIDKRRPYGYVYLDPENPNFDEYNVYYEGHHQSRGVELEADGTITRGLSFTGGIGFTSAKVITDPGYPSGNKLPNAPRFAGNGWLTYAPFSKFSGIHVATGVFYKGSFYSSITNDPNLKIPSGYTWDAAMGYKYKSVGLQLNVTNITNQISYLNPWQFNLFDVKPLRQFVITLNYHISKN
ncbi:MAG: TonB-dependent siderophore receptor [Bacteroidota bacterium]